MGNFRKKLYDFFRDRYGIDELGKAMIAVYIILVFITAGLGIFLRGIAMLVIRLIMFLFAAVIIFRMLSKSIYLRRNENEKYKKLSQSIKSWFKLQNDRFRDRKTHVYKKCPKCRAVLRLKRIKGDHRAVCPRCSESFEVHVR